MVDISVCLCDFASGEVNVCCVCLSIALEGMIICKKFAH